MPFTDAVPQTIIDLVNVSTGFPGRSVLAGINLRVNRGDLVLIEGATGAGKTTLIRLILGALPVQSGVARILGADLGRVPPSSVTDLRRHLGTVFQTPRFLEKESVLTNVSLPLAILGESSSRCRAEGTRMLMDANLAGATRKRPFQLSGGEQARLQIARALIHKPYLVLADEPFAHLDPESAAESEDLLAAAHERGITILITSHRQTKLAERARRLRLENGGLI